MDGRALTAILLTHTHRDHSAAAARLAQRYGVPLWFGGQHRLSRPLRRFERNPIKRSCDWDLMPDRTLRDGETIEAGDMAATVHTTPGHCANHLAFGLADANILLSGDHKKIEAWRREQSEKLTADRRPDLLHPPHQKRS